MNTVTETNETKEWKFLTIAKSLKAKREAHSKIKTSIIDNVDYDIEAPFRQYDEKLLLIEAEYDEDVIVSTSFNDFFDITKTGEIRIRDIQQFLAGPFFTPEKVCKYVREFHTEDGQIALKIVPSIEGCPTAWDKDLITYTISHCVQMLDDKKLSPLAERAPLVKIDGYKMCETVNRPVKRISENDKTWKQWNKTGTKLRSSFVETNTIFFGGKKVTKQTFLQTFKMAHDKSGDKFIIEVRLEDWIWNAVRAGYVDTENKAEILSLDKNYYEIRKGLERRMYEILKKFLNNTKNNQRAKFEVSLKKFKDICGNRSTDIDFKKDLIAIIKKYDHTFYSWRINVMDGTKFRAVNLNWIKEVNAGKNELEKAKVREQILA